MFDRQVFDSVVNSNNSVVINNAISKVRRLPAGVWDNYLKDLVKSGVPMPDLFNFLSKISPTYSSDDIPKFFDRFGKESVQLVTPHVNNLATFFKNYDAKLEKLACCEENVLIRQRLVRLRSCYPAVLGKRNKPRFKTCCKDRLCPYCRTFLVRDLLSDAFHYQASYAGTRLRGLYVTASCVPERRPVVTMVHQLRKRSTMALRQAGNTEFGSLSFPFYNSGYIRNDGTSGCIIVHSVFLYFSDKAIDLNWFANDWNSSFDFCDARTVDHSIDVRFSANHLFSQDGLDEQEARGPDALDRKVANCLSFTFPHMTEFFKFAAFERCITIKRGTQAFRYAAVKARFAEGCSTKRDLKILPTVPADMQSLPNLSEKISPSKYAARVNKVRATFVYGRKVKRDPVRWFGKKEIPWMPNSSSNGHMGDIPVAAVAPAASVYRHAPNYFNNMLVTDPRVVAIYLAYYNRNLANIVRLAIKRKNPAVLKAVRNHGKKIYKDGNATSNLPKALVSCPPSPVMIQSSIGYNVGRCQLLACPNCNKYLIDHVIGSWQSHRYAVCGMLVKTGKLPEIMEIANDLRDRFNAESTQSGVWKIVIEPVPDDLEDSVKLFVSYYGPYSLVTFSKIYTKRVVAAAMFSTPTGFVQTAKINPDKAVRFFEETLSFGFFGIAYGSQPITFPKVERAFHRIKFPLMDVSAISKNQSAYRTERFNESGFVLQQMMPEYPLYFDSSLSQHKADEADRLVSDSLNFVSMGWGSGSGIPPALAVGRDSPQDR